MATRYLTLLLGAVQAYGVTVTMMNSDYITLTDTTILGYLKIIVYLVAGSMLLMWLGDQITTKGIGNGISMIIFAGIVSALPNQIYGAFANYLSQNLLTGNPSLILEGVIKLLLYLLSFFLIVVFVTYTENQFVSYQSAILLLVKAVMKMLNRVSYQSRLTLQVLFLLSSLHQS